MLFIHITIALASVAYATYLFLAPAARKFYAHYTLMGLTVASGTYLAAAKPAHILETCVMGLLYIGFVSVATLFAYRRLAAQKIHNQD